MSSRNEQGFALNDLIEREQLQLCGEATDIDVAFDYIIPKNEEGTIDDSLLIGVDGSVTAGKSFVATSLHAYLTQRETDCVVVRGDWFMASRAERKLEIGKAMSGDYPISAYDVAACNFDELARTQQRIHSFLQAGHEACEIEIPNAYNRATGELDQTINLDLRRGSVAVFEGTGVLNSVMHQAFDLSVRVDVGTYQGTIERLAAREAEKNPAQRLAMAFIKERYDLIDYPYDQYLRSRDSQYFDVLLDTSNPISIKVYERRANTYA